MTQISTTWQTTFLVFVPRNIFFLSYCMYMYKNYASEEIIFVSHYFVEYFQNIVCTHKLSCEDSFLCCVTERKKKECLLVSRKYVKIDISFKQFIKSKISLEVKKNYCGLTLSCLSDSQRDKKMLPLFLITCLALKLNTYWMSIFFHLRAPFMNCIVTNEMRYIFFWV